MAAAAIDADAETDAAVPQGWEKRVGMLKEEFPEANTADVVAALGSVSPRGHVHKAKDVLKASIEPKRKAKALARASAEMQQRAACLEEAWRELIAGAQDEGACMRQITEQEASGQCPTRHKFDAIDYKNPGPPEPGAEGIVTCSWQREDEKNRGVQTCAKHRDLYHGELRSGLPCGFGYMSYGAPGYHHEYKDGVFAEEYEGRFGEHGLPECTVGRYQFCSGDVYIGPLTAGRFSGGIGWFCRGPHPNDVVPHVTFKEKLVLRRESESSHWRHSLQPGTVWVGPFADGAPSGEGTLKESGASSRSFTFDLNATSAAWDEALAVALVKIKGAKELEEERQRRCAADGGYDSDTPNYTH